MKKNVLIYLIWDFMLGAFVALVVNYYLYRIGLPLSPFVYQVFWSIKSR